MPPGSKTYAVIITADAYPVPIPTCARRLLGDCIGEGKLVRTRVEEHLLHPKHGIIKDPSELPRYIAFLSATNRCDSEDFTLINENPSRVIDRRGFFPVETDGEFGLREYPYLHSERDVGVVASYDNIVNALLSVGDRVSPGDNVLVFFAGHGHQAASVVGNDPAWTGKAGSGVVDQVLCPYDSAIGGQVVRDFELNYFFNRITSGKPDREHGPVVLTVVLSACSTGGLVAGQSAPPRPEDIPQVLRPFHHSSNDVPGNNTNSNLNPAQLQATENSGYTPSEDISEYEPPAQPPLVLFEPTSKQYRDNRACLGSLQQGYRERGPGTLVPVLPAMREAWEELMANTAGQAPVGGGGGAELQPQTYTLFTSCLAHEESDNAFTPALVVGLAIWKQTTAQQLYRFIFDVAHKCVTNTITKQTFFVTPRVLGERNRQFPAGRGRRPLNVTPDEAPVFSVPTLIPITAVRHRRPMPPAPLSPAEEKAGHRERRSSCALNLPAIGGEGTNVTVPVILFLRAGTAHGVEVGTTYAVTRWMEEPEGSNPSVRVVVIQARKTVSIVAPIGSPTLPVSWETLYARELAERKNIEPKEFRNWKYQHTGDAALSIQRSGHDAEEILVDAAGAYPWPTGCVATLLTRPVSQARTVQVVGNAEELRDLAFKYLPGEVPLKLLPDSGAMPRPAPGHPGTLRIKWENGTGYQLYQQTHTVFGGPSGFEPVGHQTYSARTCLATAVHIAKYDLLRSFNTPSDGHTRCVSISHQGPAFTLLFNQAAWGTGDPTLRSHYANVVVFHFSPAPEYAVQKVYPSGSPFATLAGTEANAERTFTCNKTGGLIKMIVFFTSTSFDYWQMGPMSNNGQGGGAGGEGGAAGVRGIRELKAIDRSRELENLSYLDPKPVAGILNPGGLTDFTEEHEPLTHWYYQDLLL